MKFYQKPIYNYKLECEADTKTSMQAVQDLITGQLRDQKKQAAFIMTEWFSDTAVVTLILVLAVPAVSNYGAIVTAPLMQVFAAGMFIKGITLIDAAADQIEADVETFEGDLDWINLCIDSNVQIDYELLEQAKIEKLKVASDVRTLRNMMLAQVILVGFMILLLIVTGITLLCQDILRHNH